MAEEHGQPGEGVSCMCCWDDVDASNYVEYKWSDESSWLPSGYCETCTNHLLKTQWGNYKNSLEKTNCKAEQRRLLARGPPINISDAKAMPCPEEGEVYALWFISDNAVHSAKLEGSLLDEERQKYWDEQKVFYIADEPDEENAAIGAAGAPTTGKRKPESELVSSPK